jgi:hypothetical protein
MAFSIGKESDRCHHQNRPKTFLVMAASDRYDWRITRTLRPWNL